MAERIHLGQPGTQSRNVEEQALADAERKEVGQQREGPCSLRWGLAWGLANPMETGL